MSLEDKLAKVMASIKTSSEAVFSPSKRTPKKSSSKGDTATAAVTDVLKIAGGSSNDGKITDELSESTTDKSPMAQQKKIDETDSGDHAGNGGPLEASNSKSKPKKSTNELLFDADQWLQEVEQITTPAKKKQQEDNLLNTVELEKVRQKVLAVTYSTYGNNLTAFFDKMKTPRNLVTKEALSVNIEQLVPNISSIQLRSLMSLLKNDTLNEVEFAEFIDPKNSMSKLEERFPRKKETAKHIDSSATNENLFNEIKDISSPGLSPVRSPSSSSIRQRERSLKDLDEIFEQTTGSTGLGPSAHDSPDEGNKSLSRGSSPHDLLQALDSLTESDEPLSRKASPHAHIQIDKEVARKLFNKIDRNNDGTLTLYELQSAAEDNKSEECVLLHELLGLPARVSQEDGSKDMLARLFAEMDKSHGYVKGVTIEEFMDYLQSHHFMKKMHIERKKHWGIFEGSQGEIAHEHFDFNKDELNKIRNQLLAASYTTHGPDLEALFKRIDHHHSGSISVEDLIHCVKGLIPHASEKQITNLMKLADEDGNGFLEIGEFVHFMDPQGTMKKKMEKQRAKLKAKQGRSTEKNNEKLFADRPEWNASPRQHNKSSRNVIITEGTVEDEIEQLRNKLLAASYSYHGADIGALFDRLEKGKGENYEMSVEELAAVIRKVLPKLTDRHLEVLMKLADSDHNGKLSREEFISFIKNKKYSHHLDWGERTKATRSSSSEGRASAKKRIDPFMVPSNAGGFITDVVTPNKQRSLSTERRRPERRSTISRNMCRPMEDKSETIGSNSTARLTKGTTPRKMNDNVESRTYSRQRSGSVDSSVKYDRNGNRLFTPQNRRLPYNNQDLESRYKMSENDEKIQSEWSFDKIRATHTDEKDRQIQGAIRVRPFSIGERQQAARRIVSVNRTGDKLVLVNPNAREDDIDPDMIAAMGPMNHTLSKDFSFDHCLWSYNPEDKHDIYIDQAGVYNSVGVNLASKVMKGTSITCFAYGHTGTGKTHTMFGNIRSLESPTEQPSSPSTPDGGSSILDSHSFTGLDLSKRLPSTYGLIPRLFSDIVNRVKSEPSVEADTKITLSFIEVYNEKIYDLLNQNDDGMINHNTSADLKIRDSFVTGAFIEGLSKVAVNDINELIKLLIMGVERRSVGTSLKNSVSSRSHCIVTLELTSLLPKKATTGKSQQSQQHGFFMHRDESPVRVQMVDLAGSEQGLEELKANNVRKSDVELMEVKLIRRSLSTLGYIVKEMGRRSKYKHTDLPFKDSTITHLLRDSFLGHCYTTMVYTISPADICYEETLNTLKYAGRLAHVEKRKQLGDSVWESKNDPLIRKLRGLGKVEDVDADSGEENVNSTIEKNEQLNQTKVQLAATEKLANELEARKESKSLSESLIGSSKVMTELLGQIRLHEEKASRLKTEMSAKDKKISSLNEQLLQFKISNEKLYETLNILISETEQSNERLNSHDTKETSEEPNTDDPISVRDASNASPVFTDAGGSKIITELLRNIKEHEDKISELTHEVLVRDQKYDKLLRDFAKAEEQITSLTKNAERPAEVERNELLEKMDALVKENATYKKNVTAINNNDVDDEKNEVAKYQKIIKSLENALKKAELEVETERLKAQKSGLKLRINTIENQTAVDKQGEHHDGTKEMYEKEFKSLWNAIEELSKLDADRESIILQNMTELENEIKDLKSNNEALQAENDVLQKLQDTLEDMAIENNEAKIADKDRDIESLVKANSNLKQKLEDDWDAYQRLQKELESKSVENEKLLKVEESLDKDNRALKNESEGLKIKCKELQDELATADAGTKQKDGLISRLREEVETLRVSNEKMKNIDSMQINELMKDNENYRVKLATLENQIAALQKMIVDRDEHVEVLKDEIASTRNHNADEVNNLKEIEESQKVKIEELGKELSIQNDTLEQKEKSIISLKTDIDSLKKSNADQMDDLDRQVATQKDFIMQKDKSIQGLKAEIEGLQKRDLDQIDDLQRQINVQKDVVSKRDKTIKNLKNELESLKRDSNDQIDELHREITASKDIVSRKDKALKNLKDELDSLKGGDKAQIEDLQRRLDTQKDIASKGDKSIKNLKDELDRLKRDNNDQIDDLQREVTAQKDIVSKRDKTVKNLKDELDSLKGNSGEQIADLERQLKAQKSITLEKEKSMKSLNDELSDAKKSVEQLSSVADQRDALASDLIEAKKKLTTVEAELDDKNKSEDGRVKELMENARKDKLKLIELENLLKEKNDTITKKDKSIQGLQDELNQTKKDAEDRGLSLESYTNEVEHLKSQILALEKEDAEEREELTKHKEEIKEQEKNIARHKLELHDQEVEIDRHKTEISRQKEEINVHKEEIKKQNEEIRDHKEEIMKQNQEITLHKDEIRQQNKEISGHKDEIREQNRVILEQQKTISQQKDNISELDEKIKQLNSEVESHKKQIVDYKSEITKQHTEIQTHLDAMKKQETQIEELQKEKDKLDAQHEAHIAEVTKLKQSIDSDKEKELEAAYQKRSSELEVALENAKNEYLVIGKSLDETEEALNSIQEELDEEKRQHTATKAELAKLKGATPT